MVLIVSHSPSYIWFLSSVREVAAAFLFCLRTRDRVSDKLPAVYMYLQDFAWPRIRKVARKTSGRLLRTVYITTFSRERRCTAKGTKSEDHRGGKHRGIHSLQLIAFANMDKDRRRSQPIPHLSKHIHPYPFVTRKNPALMKTKENPAISYPLGQSSLFLGPEGRANVCKHTISKNRWPLIPSSLPLPLSFTPRARSSFPSSC